jgi:magnesium transporter
VFWHSCARYLEPVTVTTAAPPGQPQASKNWPVSIYRRPDGTLEQDVSPARIREILQAGEGELWVDIDSTSMHQHALLEKVFEFHPLAIEDTLSPGSRVKFEEYDRYVFVVMAVIRFDEGTPEPFDLATSNIYFFLGKNFLVTVHAVPSKSCGAIRERLMRNPELLSRGVEMTMHNIIDQSVDAYFPLVEQLNELVDGLEERLFERFDETLIHEIFKAKRASFSMRRHVGPLREVLNILTNRPCTYIRPETQLYYRDIYDHTIRIVESMDTVRDLLAGVLETYLSQTSNRMNKVMKQLSIVATIALPLIVIGGIYGMNFTQMPLTHNPFGFYFALGTMAVVSGVILWWLHRNRWL